MRILALQGVANTGKTTRIKELIQELEKRGAAVIEPPITSPLREECLLMRYRGCQIGVTTLGDSDECLNLLFDRAENCILCICACRTHGSTIKEICKRVGENDCIFLPKWECDSKTRNLHTVQLMLSLTDWMIDRYYYEKQLEGAK